nr:oocyte zinc finger protein XlCOF6-like [Penaeus vannamei]
MMSSTQAIDDPSHKPLIQIIDPVDPEECATVNVEEDDSGNIQNKTTTSPCLMCGSSDGSISAFARIGINGDDTEPLISVLSSILNKAVVDIPLHTEVVCTKCFKKFEAILKLQNKLVEICRDVIHSFNKAVTKFVKTVSLKTEDSFAIPIIGDINAEKRECGIVGKALSLANTKKSEKKQDTKNERKYKCKVCDKSFIAYSHRVEHMLTHTKEKEFKCEICGIHMSTRSNLTRHKQQHTKECICSICNRKLCSKTSLKDHMKIHNNDKPHHCQYCGKSFTRFQHRRVHEKLHKVEELGAFQCNVCEKRFVVRSRLARHMLIHNKEKQFVCQLCNKRFARKDDLKNHERSHTGERPYICKECGKTFRYISNCRHHMKIHMKESNGHRCTHCNMSFPSEAKYEYHLKTRNHKKKVSESEFGSTDYMHCNTCNTTFISTDFMKHKATCSVKTLKQETSEEQLYCRICCLTFDHLEKLTEHSLHAHHMEGNALSQVNDTGIIISPVDGGEELVSLTPLTVTEGVNMVVAVDPSNRTLEIPVVQAESGATSLLPTSTLISETSTVLTECLGNGTTNLVSNAGVTSGELTEIASESGIVSGEVVGQATIEHTINADDTVTILNPSTIFKISDWGIH